MGSSTLPPVLTQVILFILVSVPPLAKLFFIATRVALRSRWEAYRNASEEKQVKSARDISKSIVFLVLFFVFLPMTVKVFEDWSRGQFLQPPSPFRLYYNRILISIIPAFFVFELVHIDKIDPFQGLHHVVSLIVTTLVVTGTIVGDAGDAAALIKTSILLYQIVCLEAGFAMGHGIARIWPVSRRRYNLLCYLTVYKLVLILVFQVMLWSAFGSHVQQFSGDLPIVKAACVSVFVLIVNAHACWLTFSIARGVRKRWKFICEEENVDEKQEHHQQEDCSNNV